MIPILEGSAAWAWIRGRVDRLESDQDRVRGQVAPILEQVRREGDAALVRLTQRFDGVALEAARLHVAPEEIAAARSAVGRDFLDAIEYAAKRIHDFHAMQLEKTATLAPATGETLTLRVRGLASVGAYVPGGTGGTTPLVSTALMTLIPAVVAGVARRVAVSPPRADGTLDPHLLVALDRAGAHEIYRVGGAQAVAALAYGTATIAPVDKIVGPGNVYVATAKSMVTGRVDIDRVAGPSEIAILADDTAPADMIAADLLAQAEHDPRAMAVLVTTERALVDRVLREVEEQARTLTRGDIARGALDKEGAMLVCRDHADGLAMVDALAAEHVEILTRDARGDAERVRAAGAIFVGPLSPQALGDYVAGPNHTLPTGGTARFASPLGVWDFVTRTSVVEYSAAALEEAMGPARLLARLEGLEAHERSIAIRGSRVG